MRDVTSNKLRWIAMTALSFTLRMKLADEIVVRWGDRLERFYHRDQSVQGLLVLDVSDAELADLDVQGGEDRVRSTLPDRILAVMNPFAVGML